MSKCVRGLKPFANSNIDASDIPATFEVDFAWPARHFPASEHSGGAAAVSTVTAEVATDKDILAWFQAQGQEYPQRMRAALRLYAEVHQSLG